MSPLICALEHGVSALCGQGKPSRSALISSFQSSTSRGAPGWIQFGPLMILDDLERRVDRHDPVVVAMDDQRRDVELLRSSVKSVSENALMQSMTPGNPACIPCSQNQSRRPCETFEPGRLAP